MKTISGEVTSVFPEFNCFEINSNIFFHGVKASTVKKLKLGEKVSIEYKKKKIKSGDWTFIDFIFLKFQKNNNINKTTMKKEYNARGERIYTNAVKRENARKKEKNKKTNKI